MKKQKFKINKAVKVPGVRCPHFAFLIFNF